MFPAYTGMNSYPYQRNQIPFTQYYHPSCEAVPPQMKEDSTSSSCMHESSPHNYGHPALIQCHSCCTHGQYPAYYNFRPPCSLFPPPPPQTYNHSCGGYPPFPQSHPMYYAPPPHYSMELPRYEFDKSVPWDKFHCCGCSNHPCHMKGRNNVKIEEQEPDVEMKKSESLFPAGANNFQYPIMWIPHEHMKNKELPRRLVENEASGQEILPYLKKPQVQRKPSGTEEQDNEGSPFGKKPHQSARSVEQDPNLRNGWFPLDINRIKQLMDGGEAMQSCDQVNKSQDENKAHGVENKDQNKQSSYPIIWIPYNGQMGDHSKGREDKYAGGSTAEESPATLKDVPRKLEHTESEAEKGKTTAGYDGSRIGTLGNDKRSNVRTILVKQLEEPVHKLSKKEDDADRAPLSKVSQDSVKNCTGRQPSSPTKKFKLPPICLRVDPPKKKNGNGSSRSPSPPGDKKGKKFYESSSRPSKEIKVKDVEKIPSQNKFEASHSAGDAKEESENLKDQVPGAEKMVMEQADSDKSEDAKIGDVRVLAQEAQAEKEGESQQESKQERKGMSDMEAAIVIQSVYRGYNVRRWEPLKKLKQIAKVHEEAILVKKHIEDLESLSAIEDKDKTAIGETIMNLLLKLDAIQGLHEIIRDVRRSVAKELINLQEKLDSITCQKPSQLARDTPATEESTKDSVFIEGSTSVVESSAESSEGSSLYREKGADASEGDGISSKDLSLGQPPLCQDVGGYSQNKITSEELVVNMDSRDKTVESPARCDGDVAAAGLGSEMIEKEPNLSETVQGQSSIESQESFVNANLVEDTVMDDDMESGNRGEEANLLSQLPQEVIEEEFQATAGPVEDTKAQNDLASGIKDQGENQLLELPQEVNESLANVNIAEDTAGQNGIVAVAAGNEDQEADFISELPIEAIEDDEKETPTGHDLGASNFASPSDDGKELTEVETSGHLNNHQEVDQPKERLEVGNEDIVGKDHGNHESLEISSKGTVSGQEAGSIISPANIEMPIMEEVYSKLQESTGVGQVAAAEPSVLVERDVEVPPLKENQDEVKVESSEISNVECSSSATLLIDPFDNNEDASEILAGGQGNEPKAVNPDLPEPDMQQSKEKCGTVEESLDDQSLLVGGKKDEHIDKKVIEENEKLREMLEKLLAAGKEQQEVISSLNGKVKDLENKLTKKKNKKSAKRPRVRVSRPPCGKPANGSPKERSVGIAS